MLKNKNMNRYLFKISNFIVGVFAVLLPSRAFALDPGAITDVVGGKISTENDISSIVVFVVGWILLATFSVAVMILLIGGFRYITSAGNESQAEAAKETITKAIIGLVIILLAYVIVSTINNLLVNSTYTP